MGGVACDADGGPDCVAAGGCGMGSAGRQRPGVHGPAAAKRPASNRKIAASGQAVGNQTRMRAAPSTTRAASLIKRSRTVANSAGFPPQGLGAAARQGGSKPEGGGWGNKPERIGPGARAEVPGQAETGV